MQDRVDHGADVGLVSHHPEIHTRVDDTFSDEDKAFQPTVLDDDLPVLAVTHVPVDITLVVRADPTGEDGLSKDRQDIPVNLSGYALLTFRITHRISNVIRRRLPQTRTKSRK